MSGWNSGWMCRWCDFRPKGGHAIVVQAGNRDREKAGELHYHEF
jgi:hypothetical protein